MNESTAPHFIQMHLGEIDEEKINTFANKHLNVLSHQVLPFVNVDSSDITVNKNLFTDSSQDNGFTHQSENFDFLLDYDNNVAHPRQGEVYVPLSYYLNGKINIGDEINVGGMNLKVIGPIRDVQMNSTLSSSKRFLVHPNDLEKIKTFGNTEYLIEFLLTDTKYLSSFQGDFSEELNFNNGPTITYPLIRLINGLTEGIKLALIFLICLLTLLISFLCIRFSVLTRIEKETLEIGVLKGIGMTVKNIKSIYLAKYLAIASVASFFGFIISIFIGSLLMYNIKKYFGANINSNSGIIFGFISSLIVMAITIFYIYKLLNKFKEISPVKAISGVGNNEDLNIKNINLNSSFAKSSKGYLSIVNLLNRKKLYFTFSVIIILTSFIISIPIELYSSFNSRDFVKYMGIGDVDIIMSKQSNINSRDVKFIEEYFTKSEEIDSYSIITQKSVQIKLDRENSTNLWLNYGNHSIFPINYISGKSPTKRDEIAISYLSAKELDKKVGDKVELISDDKIIPLKLVGVYSDITNGGMTGQLNADISDSEILRTSIYIRGKDNVNSIINNLTNNFPNYKIVGVDDYREEILGSTVNNLNQISKISVVIGLFIIIFITTLFNNLFVVEDRRETSILKAIGFVSNKITYKYYFGALLISTISMVIGTILSRILGEIIASAFMKNLGVGSFSFTSTGFIKLILILPLIIILIYVSTKLSVAEVSSTQASDYIKE